MDSPELVQYCKEHRYPCIITHKNYFLGNGFTISKNMYHSTSTPIQSRRKHPSQNWTLSRSYLKEKWFFFFFLRFKQSQMHNRPTAVENTSVLLSKQLRKRSCLCSGLLRKIKILIALSNLILLFTIVKHGTFWTSIFILLVKTFKCRKANGRVLLIKCVLSENKFTNMLTL